MGAWLSLPLLMLAAILQTTLLPQLRLWDGAPDLVLLCTLVWSLRASLREALVWALAGGIMLDLLSVAPVGQSAAGLVLVVFATNTAAGQLRRVGPLALALMTIAAALFQQLWLWLLFGLQGHRMDFPVDLAYVILPGALYSLALVWPLAAFLRPLQRRVAPRVGLA